jgi:hypothetical protein
MPQQEFVKQEFVNCYGAAPRLASEWNIPYLIAQNIVKGVLRGGECPVRGKGFGEMVVRDIREDIAEALLKYRLDLLIPWGFSDVEIDWNGLIEYGRPLVPSAYEFVVQEAEKSRSKKPRSAKPDANDELRATEYVTGLLKANPSMSREDARQACAEKFPQLGKNAFERRVWKRARKALSLGRAMSPGRPKL